ncbi:MAG: crossover junction endodeoxyribonuclease RuvC [Clostridia bacterium]|nr:crossover junction endodeoxyribonuclease RuvC [Clostridia bacterium]
MRILGFDPGFAIVGYGIIDLAEGGVTVVDYGVITTPKEDEIAVRLASIANCADELIKKYAPDEIAMEELFFARNTTTGIRVAEAKGVLMVCGINQCGKLFEYTPLQVKMALTGYGRAEKRQIQEMVRMLLCLPSIPKPDDAADALAVALTHAQSRKLGARMMR